MLCRNKTEVSVAQVFYVQITLVLFRFLTMDKCFDFEESDVSDNEINSDSNENNQGQSSSSEVSCTLKGPARAIYDSFWPIAIDSRESEENFGFATTSGNTFWDQV